MSHHRRHKELTAIVTDAGATVESITPTSGGNTRVIGCAPNGVKKSFFFSTSPGDPRADKNNEAIVRRWVRENGGTADQQAPVGTVGLALVKATATKVEPPPALPTPVTPPETPETPAKEITMTSQKKITRTVLARPDFYKLCVWLQTADISKMYTFMEVAKAASDALTLTIPSSAAQQAMETVGVLLPETPDSAAPKDRVRVVARELATFMRKFDMDPSPELLALMGGKRL